MNRTLLSLNALGLIALTLPMGAQISDNKALTGKYYFRQVSMLTDSNGTVTEARTGWGTMTFDGNGSLSFQGSQMVGANPAQSLTGTGSYAVKAGAFATISNPLRSGTNLNARVGTGAVVGSSTESGTTLFDFFIALPAPVSPAVTSAATLSGAYWVSSLEIPNGSSNLVRDTWFKLQSNGNGAFGDATVAGEAVNLGSKQTNLQIPGVTYSVAPDGTGTLNLPMPASSTFSDQLIGGLKSIYVSPDGSFFIGGHTTNSVHGMVIGVQAFNNNGSNANFSGLYWGAGIRFDQGQGRFSSFTGSANGTGAAGNGIWYRRVRQTDALVDFTPLIPFGLSNDGSGRALAGKMAMASTSQSFVGSAIGVLDTPAYELYFGIKAPAQSASGVFLNPQGIFNAASFAPAGNPVAPGELITAYGAGLAASTVTSGVPFPPTLGNVTVTVNGTVAPIYYVSPSQMSFLIPFGTKGSTATIVVTNNGKASNAVDIPLAVSAPGIFSLPQTGIGAGAVLHADFSVVNAQSPAKRGETVLVYLTGLGLTSPQVPDGTAAPSNPLSVMTAPIAVYIGNLSTQATVIYKGLAPTLAGLYQLNITIPLNAPTGTVGMSLQTTEAFTDLVDITIAQ